MALSEKVDHVILKVDEIWRVIIKGNGLKSSSPLSLSESGQSVSGNISAKALAGKYVEKLKTGENSAGLSAFKIQVKSMDFATDKLMDLLTPKEKATVENEAFQRGWDIKKVLEVVALS